MVIEAIKKAVLSNRRSLNYIKGILNDWNNKGFKKVIDVKNEEQEFRKSKENNRQREETEDEKKDRKIRELQEAMKNDDS